jgi:hypothetical protein
MVWHLQPPMGFHREQQFFGQSFLLLLLMVGFGENLRVHFSECCANEQENADLVFGMVTILSGILGTVVGGIFLDHLGSTIRNGFKVCYLGLIICCKHWKNEEVNSTTSAELLSKSILII